MPSTRQTLIDLYLDFFNNWLTFERYAEHHGITTDQASTLILLAREIYLSKHPEA